MASSKPLNLVNAASGTVIAEPSKTWLTTTQIDNSPLDSILRSVYTKQLEELQKMVLEAEERTVEQFVAMEEMEAITSDFWRAVRRVRTEKEAAKKVEQDEGRGRAGVMGEGVVGVFRGSESAEVWRRFRRGEN